MSRASVAAGGVGAGERELIRRLTRMLAQSFTKQGHLAQRNEREGRGYCSHRRCSPLCIQAGALLVEADAYLLSVDETPVQPRLLEEVAG